MRLTTILLLSFGLLSAPLPAKALDPTPLIRVRDHRTDGPRPGTSPGRFRQVAEGSSLKSVASALAPQRVVDSKEPHTPCTSATTLTLGLPYSGNTTGQGNDFQTDTSYPGLNVANWCGTTPCETGPDVVHRVTLSKTADLRVHLDVDPVTLPDLDVILVPGGITCDTANWELAGDHTIIYPDAPAGTYTVIVDGFSAADEGGYTLTVAAAEGLLLVDDDGSGDTTQCTATSATGCPDVQAEYLDALLNMATPPSVTAWDVNVLGPPPPATLNSAHSVIWFTGASYEDGKTITNKDEESLAAYLDLGGRLMLVGQDVLWDVTDEADGRLPDGSLFNDYMSVNEVFHDVWDSSSSAFTIDGIVGNPIGDVLNCNDSILVFDQVTTGAGAPFTAWADSLISRGGDPVYYNNYISGDTRSQKPAGVRGDHLLTMYSPSGLVGVDDFKTFFLAFAPECADPASILADMTNLFEETLAWFDEDYGTFCAFDFTVGGYFDDTTGNGNGIPDPGETFDLVIEVTNDDAVARSVKLYLSFEDYYVTRVNDATDPPYEFCMDLGSIASGATASGTFVLQLLGSTPVGYRINPQINVIDAGSGESFCFAQAFGIFSGQPDVLLVKDEWVLPNTTGLDTYTSLLSTLGYDHAVWETDLFGPPTYDTIGLSNDRMANYDFVVWFTGFDPLYTLTPAYWESFDPEVELATYLNNGNTNSVAYGDPGSRGRLIVSSQDYLYDRYNGNSQQIPTADFASTHLKVFSVVQDYLKDTSASIYGIDGAWPASKMRMGLQNEQVFRNYADRIEINADESGNLGLWAFQTNPQLVQAGVVNLDKTRTSRFTFLPFAFENIQDVTPGGFDSKQRFLERLMCQMQMTSSDSVPPCGYFGPASEPESGSLRATAQPTETLFTWDPVSFTNSGAEPIEGFFRVRRGSCASLTSGPTDLPVVDTTPIGYYAETGVPAAGEAWCFNVIDYEDLFGQAADLNSPPLP